MQGNTKLYTFQSGERSFPPRGGGYSNAEGREQLRSRKGWLPLTKKTSRLIRLIESPTPAVPIPTNLCRLAAGTRTRWMHSPAQPSSFLAAPSPCPGAPRTLEPEPSPSSCRSCQLYFGSNSRLKALALLFLVGARSMPEAHRT